MINKYREQQSNDSLDFDKMKTVATMKTMHMKIHHHNKRKNPVIVALNLEKNSFTLKQLIVIKTNSTQTNTTPSKVRNQEMFVICPLQQVY